MRDLLSKDQRAALLASSVYQCNKYVTSSVASRQLQVDLGPGGETLKKYANAVEELIEASKELLQNLEDAGQTHNDREQDDDAGEEHPDVAAVRKALQAFGVDA